jgi:type II secretory pathway pseudopilin PulG
MKSLLPNLKQKKGYTIVELMITVTIVIVLVSFGFSAYTNAQERQAGQAAAERIMGILKENQQAAAIGKKDNTKCIDGFLGQQVTIMATSNRITTQGLCTEGNDDLIELTISGITFENGTSQVILFKPLSGGVDLGGPSELFINFTGISELSYRIRLTTAGTIEYQGIQ